MPCFYCPARLAWRITAGNPANSHPDAYRQIGTCTGHVDRGRTWASAAGPPTVVPLDDGPEPANDQQPTLFDLPRSTP